MEFPWRCNVDTIAMDLKVSWEMSDQVVTDFQVDTRLQEIGADLIAPRLLLVLLLFQFLKLVLDTLLARVAARAAATFATAAAGDQAEIAHPATQAHTRPDDDKSGDGDGRDQHEEDGESSHRHGEVRIYAGKNLRHR